MTPVLIEELRPEKELFKSLSPQSINELENFSDGMSEKSLKKERRELSLEESEEQQNLSFQIGQERLLKFLMPVQEDFKLKGQIFDDQTRLRFLNNNNTPNTRSDDFIDYLEKEETHLSADLFGTYASWYGEISLDQKSMGRLTRKRKVGQDIDRRFEIKANSQGDWRFRPEFWWQKNRFQSEEEDLASSTGHSWQGSFSVGKSLIYNLDFDLAYKNEFRERKLEGLERQVFRREGSKLRISWHFPFKSLKGEIFYSPERVEDKALEKTTVNWHQNLGVEGKVPLVFDVSIKAKAIQSEKRPRPSFVFGEGSFLNPNLELLSIKGRRAQLGVGLEKASLMTSFYLFYEEIENQPLLFANSASSVKALGLGGLSSQGLVYELSWAPDWGGIETFFQAQDSKNETSLSWQKGRPLPGYPRYQGNLSIFLGRQLKFGQKVSYRSREAISLDGSLSLNPRVELSPFVTYKRENWLITFEVDNLFPRDPQSLPFEGTYGSLEPVADERRYFLKGRILL